MHRTKNTTLATHALI